MKDLLPIRRLVLGAVAPAMLLVGCSSTLTMPPPVSPEAAARVVAPRPPTPPAGSVSSATPKRSADARARAVDAALSMVGAPYRYGGRTPSGFDCSGLVSYAFDAAGLAVPRTTSGQLGSSAAIGLVDAEAGDLLFFRIGSRPDHVAIFIGDGRFVHAPSTGKQVGVASLGDPYWQRRFVGVRRLAD